MLAETLNDFKIVNSVGEDLGKVKEFFFDLNTWDVSAFEISPGIFKKDRLLPIQDVHEIKDEDKLLIVRDDFEGKELPATPVMEMFPFDELKKKSVIDVKGEKVGKIYDLEVPYEKLKKLKVWKILVKTGFKDRRLRLAPNEIESVQEDINLRKSLDDYQHKME
ncbi:MAG: PRC-barrel domain-containing protein [Thermoplasmatota archaeon]